MEDILFEIKDLHLSRWIEAREDTLLAMSFANFMSALQEEALDSNWAQTPRTEILCTRQGNHVFFDWVCEVKCKNAILTPIPSACISDEQLCDHFEAQMNKALTQHCQKSSVVSITDYQTWTNAVKQEDKLLRQDLENAHSVSLNVLAANSWSHTIPASSAHSPSSALTPSLSSPSLTMPKLLDEEKKILSDHDGCFKCRRPYAGHCTRKCPSGFPEKYEQVMTAMAEAVHDSWNCVHHVVAVLDAIRLDEDLPSTVLGTSSEESDDSDFD